MSAYQTPRTGMQPANPRRRNGTTKKPGTEPAPVTAGLRVRIAPKLDDASGGPRARVLVKLRSGTEVEITRTIVAAIAHALWESRGEDHLTNWIDAESVLNQLMGAVEDAPPAPSPRAGRQAPPRRDDDDLLLPEPLLRTTRSRRF